MINDRYGLVREWIKNFTRSKRWQTVRHQFVLKFPICECCGTTLNLNVHHIHPVRWYPDLELNPYNFITLCRRHHLEYGHFGNWKRWNPNVVEMSRHYRTGYTKQKRSYEIFNKMDIQPDYEKCINNLRYNTWENGDE